MKRLFGVSALAAVAASMLFASASTCFAGGGPPQTVPEPGAGPDSSNGVVAGYASFPNEVFIIANKDPSNPGGGAEQSQCAGANTRADIKDMVVGFWTKTSGLAKVHFCGVLDQFGGDFVGLRALVDSEPGSDVQCQPGDIYWNQTSTNGDGPVCFTWLCEVTNPDNCGRRKNRTCWAEHEVKIQCGTDSGSPGFGDAQFSERYLQVQYNKFGKDRDDDD